MILIVASNKDPASLNIRKQVLRNYDFQEKAEKFESNPVYEAKINGNVVKLTTLNNESIYAQHLPESFANLQLVVFISRHSSTSGTPTLSVHTPGNFAEAALGGIPKTLSVSPANLMRKALITMLKLKNEMHLGYEVSYECTHHGPSFNLPTMFVELGSSPQQWSDLKAAEVVAHSAMEAVKQFGNYPLRTVMGIGGPHYNAKFTRMALESDLAFGHMVPKYTISKVDSDMLKQCAERTIEKVETAILDWKGIKGEDKPKLVEALNRVDVKFEKA
ncbi:MAG TPA: D-aminoacyl-tRNA deacylase [Patescibacteria group bacterium]|nr:D-aminoacyl-tRNA deacylase [Patescibacteria group bacterium]